MAPLEGRPPQVKLESSSFGKSRRRRPVTRLALGGFAPPRDFPTSGPASVVLVGLGLLYHVGPKGAVAGRVTFEMIMSWTADSILIIA